MENRGGLGSSIFQRTRCSMKNIRVFLVVFGVVLSCGILLWFAIDMLIDAMHTRKESELALVVTTTATTADQDSPKAEPEQKAPLFVPELLPKMWWENEKDEDPYRGMYQIYAHRYAETWLITEDGAKKTGGHGGSINLFGEEGQYKTTVLMLREKGFLKPGDRITFSRGKDRFKQDVLAVDVSGDERDPLLIEPLREEFWPEFVFRLQCVEKEMSYLLFHSR